MGHASGFRRRQTKMQFGQKFTGHWVVKPGREVNKTRRLQVPPTPIRHDHPLHRRAPPPLRRVAWSSDRSDGQQDSVQGPSPTQTEGKIGSETHRAFRKRQGDPDLQGPRVRADQRLQQHDRTKTQDSMAVMYLYVEDQHFKKPTPETIAEMKKKANEPQEEEPAKAEDVIMDLRARGPRGRRPPRARRRVYGARRGRSRRARARTRSRPRRPLVGRPRR